ncbi:hypothetical protein [Truepera radiovictrix]|uniref:hypothetical protein n=1 Tax=Truepera radiovictrix TaxID=332249 RepID=UPI0002FB13B9|nr:hypothetical protein [Truepera radiovictrix]WMT56339.1 hypothetical protein RCV51_10020 [Truepera radiovictrix]
MEDPETPSDDAPRRPGPKGDGDQNLERDADPDGLGEKKLRENRAALEATEVLDPYDVNEQGP